MPAMKENNKKTNIAGKKYRFSYSKSENSAVFAVWILCVFAYVGIVLLNLFEKFGK